MAATVPFVLRPKSWLEPRPWFAAARWLFGVAASIRRRRAEGRDGRLTVGVDIASLFEPLTGIGWYTYELVRELARRPDVRLRLYGPVLIDDPNAPRPTVELPLGPLVEEVRYPHPGPLARGGARLAAWLHRLSSLTVAADGNRVLFAPNYLAPPHFRFARGALVATIHDLAIERVPWAVRPDSRAALAERLERTFLDAARLITPSEAVRAELIAAGHFEGGRIRAIHHGPGHTNGRDEASSPLAFDGPYGLFVGTLEPRKNLPVLLAAWRRLRARVPEARLVLAGQFGWKSEELKREIATAVAEGWAVRTGYVSAGELATLYHEADVVLMPSLYEGFGLPALEALAHGAPLIASDLPVLREVAGDAALYAPPQDPRVWAEQIERVLNNPELATSLRERGKERAHAFDWHRAAEETLAVFRAAAG